MKSDAAGKASNVTVRRTLLAVLLVIGMCVLAVFAYVLRVRASAKALIDSAVSIRSTADAERQIAVWRKCSGCSFWEATKTGDGDQNYDIHVENGFIGRLGLTEPAMVGMTVSLRNGELRYVTLVMFSGGGQGPNAGVWVQEWFGTSSADDFRLDSKDLPRKVTVEFSSAVPESERIAAFGLNAKCMVMLGGCKSVEDILPGVSRLEDYAPRKGF
jgi:hypothetical protein